MNDLTIVNSLELKLSIRIAPIGAVINIDITDTVNIILPHESPKDNAIPPMDAWTVALGIYAKIVNNLSLNVSLVLIKHNKTPNVLNNNPIIKISIAIKPLLMAYEKSTVAPTSTNKIISKNIHKLLYPSLSCLAFSLFLNNKTMPVTIIPNKEDIEI